MTVIQEMLSEYIELEATLFIRRVTKFTKISGDVDSLKLRKGRKIEFEFSNCLKNKILSKKLDCGHLATRKGRRKKINKPPLEEAVDTSNT